ncbi:hypothetical protein GLYMA_10G196900v4 [Glycine max]|uniref:DUF4220 domain-containing protein n=2 Tax=Glycine max TaxID=3847 RepID=K7LKF0_SOYBN|nr:hypothetical protein GYH30_028519 [Glycine max]KRH34650.1 hypothetical protein GLYMA_10G196900v4 [Glycine max]
MKSYDMIPDLTKAVWNVLELRLLVLISFFLQVFLIVFGNRRKCIADARLQVSVWLTYLSADWIATVALGMLSKDSKNPENDPDFIIMAIWAPFLLVHLGGPDTITAYSLEDNELYLRHFLGLLYQLSVAGYVVYISWNGNKLNYVTIPVMVAGIIKYAERTWSLWLGSSQKFRKSILPPPDPGPNYAKFMDDYTAKKAEGYKVKLKVEPTSIVLDHSPGAIANHNVADASSLHDGFYFFTIFERLFADLILSIQDHQNSQHFFKNISWNDAFQVIEVELGLMYDKLYTKAVVTYSRLGFFLKFVSTFCTLSAFVTFCCLIHKAHIDYERIITLVLFAGAIFLEIYAVIVLLSSSWAMLWLSKRKNWKVDLLHRSISCFQRCFKLSHTKRWSNLVSQFNLISFCLKDEPVRCIKIQKFLRIYQFFEKSYYQHTQTVPGELKKLIFEQLLEKSGDAKDTKACKKLCANRGDRVLDKWNCHSIAWSTEIRFEDTCAEAREVLQERKYISDRDQVLEVILRVKTDVLPSEVKGDRSKSVLFDARRLAKSIESLEREKKWSKEEKWEMMSHVWVEMLCHAASQCRGFHHAKQLSRGGELLTHVWFLMAHLGITEQFQISQGHARAKLILS